MCRCLEKEARVGLGESYHSSLVVRAWVPAFPSTFTFMQVSTRSPTDQRITDAVRVAPYLTHVIRQHGQPALMSQDNSTHSRKPKREKRPKQERQQRTHEEPHFNVGAPRTPRRGQPGSPGGRPRASRRPDVSDAGAHFS